MPGSRSGDCGDRYLCHGVRDKLTEIDIAEKAYRAIVLEFLDEFGKCFRFPEN